MIVQEASEAVPSDVEFQAGGTTRVWAKALTLWPIQIPALPLARQIPEVLLRNSSAPQAQERPERCQGALLKSKKSQSRMEPGKRAELPVCPGLFTRRTTLLPWLIPRLFHPFTRTKLTSESVKSPFPQRCPGPRLIYRLKSLAH